MQPEIPSTAAASPDPKPEQECIRKSSLSKSAEEAGPGNVGKAVPGVDSVTSTLERGGGKEESSDESTVISSQTSTLTRNQGPDMIEMILGIKAEDLQGCLDDSDEENEDEDDDDDDDEDEDEDEARASQNQAQFLHDLLCSAEGVSSIPILDPVIFLVLENYS